MTTKWATLMTLPVADQRPSIISVPYDDRAHIPKTLPAEAHVPKPNLAAVLVEGKWLFESSVQKGWTRPGPTEMTLKPGQHIFLEYDVRDAKVWSGVPLPQLRKTMVPGNCVYAGVLHDDQARLRISDDMTSIIVRVNGRVPPAPDTTPSDLIVPTREVAKHVTDLEPAGFLNHFRYAEIPQ